ncbi:MAG: hypothetical protein DRJ51_00360 [Thermoprotei archaeon]|nr:MAG: hypothetical protein DRJ51_00360 [Thermoprotei archaeon]RLF02381.1 MAG: hypothetical protein DRJ59_03790 [Thermoprotei archaeon]
MGEASIQRLDLESLLSENRVHLLTAPPGGGKTIFALQFLLNGVLKDERAAYFITNESLLSLSTGSKAFGWPLEEFQKKDMLIVYYTPFSRLWRNFEYSPKNFEQVVQAIKVTLESERKPVKRIAIDSLDGLLPLSIPTEARIDFYRRLIEVLEENSKYTCLLTASPMLGEFLAHYVHAFFEIKIARTGGNIRRTLVVRKIRWSESGLERQSFTLTLVPGVGFVLQRE